MASRTLCRPLARSAFRATAPSRAFTASTLARQAQGSPNPQQTGEKYTHFGFENVAEHEKAQRVAGVFSSVASSYDTMNDLMSLGIHRLWKDHFVRSLNPGSNSGSLTPTNGPSPSQGWNILDIAGGTGDIAFRMLDHAHNVNHSPNTRVTVSDINPDMLAEGRKRSLETPYANSANLDFLVANAEQLPVPDNSVDLYTVAFGIRNFTDKDKALREAFRVLKPGGVFACLEFSGVTNPLFEAVYKRWSFGAIPLIGQLVAGDRASYQYLVESIEKFPRQDEWKNMIQAAGFVVPGKGWEDLTGGIAAIHKGIKPVEKS
ncbi:hypothetical protein V494_04374 [Pseudogymnoascus sp. VKM F-4513 (FW-928)]|nr:hypothetical protein V494_04374 [Pseudogymnoascus sp. VKM F-4513 (FW-928)]